MEGRDAMTKHDAKRLFVAERLPWVISAYGYDDEPALAEDWNNWTDALCKCGEITGWQYANWTMPRFTRADYQEATTIALRRGDLTGRGES
jgi:hypothetical protein